MATQEGDDIQAAVDGEEFAAAAADGTPNANEAGAEDKESIAGRDEGNEVNNVDENNGEDDEGEDGEKYHKKKHKHGKHGKHGSKHGKEKKSKMKHVVLFICDPQCDYLKDGPISIPNSKQDGIRIADMIMSHIHEITEILRLNIVKDNN